MKKLMAMALAAVTAALSCGAGTHAYTLGDADENGVIDGRDASLVLTEYAQTSTGKESSFSPSQTLAADVDENSVIDGRDASRILSYYASISVYGGEIDLQEGIKDVPYEIDYSFENIAHNPIVFEYYVSELSQKIYGGKLIECNYGSTGAVAECELLLAILNYNQIDDVVLQDIIGDYTESDIRNFQNFLYNVTYAEREWGSNIDFTQYTLNPTIGEYLNSLEQAADNGTIIDIIDDAWNNDNMPEECLNHPAPYLILGSFDEYYDPNGIMYQGDVNDYILNEKVDEIISKAKGYEYHR